MAQTEDAREQLIVALDVPSRREALDLVDRLEGRCRWFKVGMELFYAEGPAIVSELRERDYRVFLDLKLHDIPNTVAGAVRSAARIGASLLTVHAAGGPAMLGAAAAAVEGDLQLLGVTVLTSMDAAQLQETGVAGTPAEQVVRLARMALRAGLPGLVCSAQELVQLRADSGDETLLVIPGIRLAGADVQDQSRVATPGDAMRDGASMLVVGRPITRASDPGRAAEAILAEIQTGKDRRIPSASGRVRPIEG